MGLLKNLQGSRLLMIQLVCWLGWLSSFGIAQFDISEGVTGSVNFPTLGITCVANLAVFVTSLIRGRLDLEIGARDALHILAGRKLKKIDGMNGNGLTTAESLSDASVVMLSNGAPNSSIREFVKSNADYAHSILLEFFPLKAVPLTIETCQSIHCNCIVFCTVEHITRMLTHRMPGTLKLLSDSLCLLPCLTCLTAGCHGCNEGLLRVEGPLPVERESDSKLVSEFLDKIDAKYIDAGESICICIPMKGARNDVWTNLLVRILRSKDAEGRGARVMASEALEWYLAGGRGGQEGTVEYGICSFIVPRLTEVVITLVLTFWFRVDGFSSSLVARRTIRDFIVDTKVTIIVLIIVTFIAFSPVVMPMLWLCFIWQKDNISGGLMIYVLMITTAISLETAWIVIGSTVAGTLGIKVFGRWIYGAFQILVWVKWATGSFYLNHGISSEFFWENP